MSENATGGEPDLDSVLDPSTIGRRPDVAFDEATRRVDGDDHPPGGGGQAAVGVVDDVGDLLLLVNREHGVALLPHAPVEAGGDWAEAARDGVEGQTGIAVALESVEAVRRVVHVRGDTGDDAAGDEGPLARTHRVVFRASPDGGAIDDCKRAAEAGSDRWVAGWYDGLPGDVSLPGDGAGDDLRLFVE